ncbi:MAG: triose-phosphate isomerase [Candidatus Nomurabacteria bacterium]|nr:MAG: triose-phosphate isomerase [Candidatus Nomurabacteria bacterium]
MIKTPTEFTKRNEPFFVLGNWKMHLRASESARIAKGLVSTAKRVQGKVTTVVFPSFPALEKVHTQVKKSAVQLGAQNMSWELDASDTGEVSAEQIKEFGASWVIIGHSERRLKLAESDEMIERKLAAALLRGLQPVLCVGESALERNQGRGLLHIMHQVESAMRYVQPQKDQVITIAYEPIWAISPGKPCEPADADEMTQNIRQVLIDRYGVKPAYQHFRILYGGSVDANNIASYLRLDEVSGVLVGSASLKIPSFRAMLVKAAQLRQSLVKKRTHS